MGRREGYRMTKLNTNSPKSGMAFWLKAVIWTVVSVIMGVAGGYAASFLAVPFYFGFFFMWVLTGLVAMFALAVHVTNEQNRPKDK